ncbi:dehydration-responsive element-binding protein 1A-like [Lycium ferocissimum]|uniref:dehydration-responsive element-binding protein 1A-like n=1 Tax=Lycium ferocissimum TaxID=112874 RepID=UPI002815F498|nr:dehydration-responsive element-binding protein 1A-like [Lycium ferocissimum]
MDIFGNFNFDPLPLVPTTSTSTSNNGSYGKANFSDEEVMMLASKTPKRRGGRKKFHETRHPVYKGVRRRNSEKWVSEVRVPGEKSRIWLGTFQTAEMAARAHDVAVMALRGRSACLNFQRLGTEKLERITIIDQVIQDVVVGELTDYNVLFMDEDALFYMPRLLANMAEGLMLPPPQCIEGYGMETDDIDMSLWSY